MQINAMSGNNSRSPLIPSPSPGPSPQFVEECSTTTIDSRISRSRSEHSQATTPSQLSDQQQSQLSRSRSLQCEEASKQRPIIQFLSEPTEKILEESRGIRRDQSFRSTRAPSYRVGITRNPSVAQVQHSASRKVEDLNQRVVYINNPGRTNENYEVAGNRVRTSKYTWYSFIPRNLFEQFHRLAYVYFLILAALNQIPQLAVFGRATSIFPLVFVLLVTAIKDGYEDWGRHSSDETENNRLAQVFQEGEYRPKKWKKIKVGELVKVYANEVVPSDIILLGTSDSSGVAYVQTINLDGESNLKTRYAHQETVTKHPELGNISGVLQCEHPNRNIYEFRAFLDLDEGGVRLPLGPNNILLRGCILKNTPWVIGVVVYAGQETKAMLNSSGAQSKRSKLEQKMNRETLWLSLFLVIMCLVGGVGMGTWITRHKEQLDVLLYYKRRDTDGENYMYYGVLGEAVIAFLSCIISFQIMIPIALYISMELVRFAQTYFMVNDVEMYHAESDSKFQCRALNINEDLGQITYVFSDKTGTLTENRMEFHTPSINGVKYSNSIVKAEEPIIKEISEGWAPKVGAKVDTELVQVLQSPIDSPESRAVNDFFLVLAACNTVVPTWVTKSLSGQLEMQVATAGIPSSGYIEYQAESPDEQALVSAAALYGYTLLERTASSIVIDVLGKAQRYEILGIHEFDSVRKLMSVVVECPDKTIKLLAKGADTSMLKIVKQQGVGDDKVLSSTLNHLGEFAREGLRTLVIASKDVQPAEYETWKQYYYEASTSVNERVEMLQFAAGLIEAQLRLLGATGIEDKLQEGVPETISCLREAGMRVWVLTGDKQETAISIGFSCALLTHEMKQIIINESTKEGCRNALTAAKASFKIPVSKRKSWWQKSSANVINSETVKGDESQELALIIDGTSLVHALSEELNQELYDLAVQCRAVLCCRVAPYQKAAIVSLIKRKAKAMTVSIGDGANDVAMIQMADIGIGISGQEGRQAVMASDFAVGQFRFIKRLLLVHGHWNYQRLAYMVLYNFYRNAVFVMMLFWYILYTAFSSQSALFDWNLVLYSLIYTSVPTVIVAIFDKDLSDKTLYKYPLLYSSGVRNEGYNRGLFWLTMLDTLWQSLVLFYVPFFTFRESTIDIWSLGCIWAIAVVLLVNLHLAMDVRHWNWMIHLAIWGSIVATFICLLILDSIPTEAFLGHYWVIYHIARAASCWLDILLLSVLALVPRLVIKAVRQRVWPSDVQIAREAEVVRCESISKQPSRESEIELQRRV